MKATRGFTLIEIAIVLVIIGLLAGGILKGQQMIENAKYKAFVAQINAYSAAVTSFQDRYKYLPGDFPKADSKLPPIASVLPRNGNGDGYIANASCGDGNCEGEAAIQHLIQAGLLKGDPSIMSPRIDTPVGGYLFTIRHTGVNSNYKISLKATFTNVPARFARRLDEERDDGKVDSGFVSACCNLTSWPDDSQRINELFVEL